LGFPQTFEADLREKRQDQCRADHRDDRRREQDRSLLCGSIVDSPRLATNPAQHDALSADPAKRTRKLKGLRILEVTPAAMVVTPTAGSTIPRMDGPTKARCALSQTGDSILPAAWSDRCARPKS